MKFVTVVNPLICFVFLQCLNLIAEPVIALGQVRITSIGAYDLGDISDSAVSTTSIDVVQDDCDPDHDGQTTPETFTLLFPKAKDKRKLFTGSSTARSLADHPGELGLSFSPGIF